MPPLPVIPATYRVALLWEHATAGHAVNVVHLRSLDGDFDANLIGLAWAANDSGNMYNTVDNDASITQFEVTPLDGSTASSVAVSGIPGTGAGEALPSLSSVLSLHTAVRGRSFRGRIFLPFLPEGRIADGRIPNADRNLVVNAWNVFLGALNGANLELVVASYKEEVATPVESISMQAVPGVQRRRGDRLR
jgi:hypothetical protein